MVSDRQFETLRKLGLSAVQAKVYLVTLKLGVATASIIAKNADVGREEVYRIFPALQEMGLVKKHITVPAKYEATPPSETMKILLLSRDEESEYLRTRADEFLDECSIGEPTDVQDVKTIIVSRDNISGVDAELLSLMRKTNSTLYFTTRQKLFFEAFNERGLTDWINEMHLAAERGVKFRMIMDGPNDFKNYSEKTFIIPNSNRLLKHTNFEFRYISAPPNCIMILFDNQACCIEMACQKETKMSPYMISNNPVFAALSKAYFELLWSQGCTEEKWIRKNKIKKHEPQKSLKRSMLTLKKQT